MDLWYCPIDYAGIGLFLVMLLSIRASLLRPTESPHTAPPDCGGCWFAFGSDFFTSAHVLLLHINYYPFIQHITILYVPALKILFDVA